MDGNLTLHVALLVTGLTSALILVHALADVLQHRRPARARQKALD